MEPVADRRLTPGAFQYTERSAMTGWVEDTIVETDQVFGTVSATLKLFLVLPSIGTVGPCFSPSSVR